MIKEGYVSLYEERVELSKKYNIKIPKFNGRMTWKACVKCGSQRWVRPGKENVICAACNRKNRLIRVDGYEVLSKGEFFERFGLRRSNSMINYPCKKCGEKHWMARTDLVRKNATGICRKCFDVYMSVMLGEKRWNFNKDYRVKYGRGYIQIRINKDNPYSCMANHGAFILEHRYVMAEHMGRPLEKWELVHHINGKKDDNRIENLELVTLKNHKGEIICPHCQKAYIVQ